jgi:N-acylneuraminate cytidylyltransferase/CMP-N,N'-diacetyllegionaminic acid synthase
MLGSMPLIAWSINAAQESGVVQDIIVSTDEKKISDLARKYGAYVPGLRPAELATDTASSVDVALHALDLYESIHGRVDGLLLLQPTSPFRSANTIRRAVTIFEAYQGARSVISVKHADPHPAWCVKAGMDNSVEPLFGWDNLAKRSQDIDEVYALDGSIYLVKPDILRSHGRFVMPDSILLTSDIEVESIDIDTELDWLIAETILRSNLLVRSERGEN